MASTRPASADDVAASTSPEGGEGGGAGGGREGGAGGGHEGGGGGGGSAGFSGLASVVQSAATAVEEEDPDGVAASLRKYSIFTFHGTVARFAKRSLCVLRETHPLRRAAAWVVMWPRFDALVLLVILLNSAILGLADYSALLPDGGYRTSDSVRNTVLVASEPFFIAFFVAEAAIKIVAMGFLTAPGSYLRNGWHVLDFLIVSIAIASLAPGANSNAMVARVVRVLRPLRAATALPSMRGIVRALVRALPSLGNVVVLIVFLQGMAAIVGLQLYSGAMHGRCRLTSAPVRFASGDSLGACTDANSPGCFGSIVNLTGLVLAAASRNRALNGSMVGGAGGNGAGAGLGVGGPGLGTLYTAVRVDSGHVVDAFPSQVGAAVDDPGATGTSFYAASFLNASLLSRCLPGARLHSDSSGPWGGAAMGAGAASEGCWWPVDPSDTAACSLAPGQGRYSCPPARWCGSNWDGAGLPRFPTAPLVQWSPLLVEDRDWGIPMFDTAISAFYTVFQTGTLEGWFAIYSRVADSNDPLFAALFFIVIVLAVGYFALSLTLAVLWESFKRSAVAQKKLDARNAELLETFRAAAIMAEITRLEALQARAEKQIEDALEAEWRRDDSEKKASGAAGGRSRSGTADVAALGGGGGMSGAEAAGRRVGGQILGGLRYAGEGLAGGLRGGVMELADGVFSTVADVRRDLRGGVIGAAALLQAIAADDSRGRNDELSPASAASGGSRRAVAGGAGGNNAGLGSSGGGSGGASARRAAAATLAGQVPPPQSSPAPAGMGTPSDSSADVPDLPAVDPLLPAPTVAQAEGPTTAASRLASSSGVASAAADAAPDDATSDDAASDDAAAAKVAASIALIVESSDMSGPGSRRPSLRQRRTSTTASSSAATAAAAAPAPPSAAIRAPPPLLSMASQSSLGDFSSSVRNLFVLGGGTGAASSSSSSSSSSSGEPGRVAPPGYAMSLAVSILPAALTRSVRNLARLSHDDAGDEPDTPSVDRARAPVSSYLSNRGPTDAAGAQRALATPSRAASRPGSGHRGGGGAPPTAVASAAGSRSASRRGSTSNRAVPAASAAPSSVTRRSGRASTAAPHLVGLEARLAELQARCFDLGVDIGDTHAVAHRILVSGLSDYGVRPMELEEGTDVVLPAVADTAGAAVLMAPEGQTAAAAASSTGAPAAGTPGGRGRPEGAHQAAGDGFAAADGTVFQDLLASGTRTSRSFRLGAAPEAGVGSSGAVSKEQQHPESIRLFTGLGERDQAEEGAALPGAHSLRRAPSDSSLRQRQNSDGPKGGEGSGVYADEGDDGDEEDGLSRGSRRSSLGDRAASETDAGDGEREMLPASPWTRRLPSASDSALLSEEGERASRTPALSSHTVPFHASAVGAAHSAPAHMPSLTSSSSGGGADGAAGGAGGGGDPRTTPPLGRSQSHQLAPLERGGTMRPGRSRSRGAGAPKGGLGRTRSRSRMALLSGRAMPFIGPSLLLSGAGPEAGGWDVGGIGVAVRALAGKATAKLQTPLTRVERARIAVKEWWDRPHVRGRVGTAAYVVLHHPLFEWAGYLAILSNVVMLSLDTWPTNVEIISAVGVANAVLMGFFTLEAVFKLAAGGLREYVSDPFNLFDFGVIAAGWVETAVSGGGPWLVLVNKVRSAGTGGAGGAGQQASPPSGASYNRSSALRLVSILRVFRLARKWTAFEALVRTAIRTFRDAGAFALLLGLFVYTFALVGQTLFANRLCFDTDTGAPVHPPTGDEASSLTAAGPSTPLPTGCSDLEGEVPNGNFDTLLNSAITVFGVFTLEGWNIVAFDAWRSFGWSASLFFFSVIVVGQYLLLDLFEAVLLSNFDRMSELKTDGGVRKLVGSAVAAIPEPIAKLGKQSGKQIKHIGRAMRNILDAAVRGTAGTPTPAAEGGGRIHVGLSRAGSQRIAEAAASAAESKDTVVPVEAAAGSDVAMATGEDRGLQGDRHDDGSRQKRSVWKLGFGWSRPVSRPVVRVLSSSDLPTPAGEDAAAALPHHHAHRDRHRGARHGHHHHKIPDHSSAVGAGGEGVQIARPPPHLQHISSAQSISSSSPVPPPIIATIAPESSPTERAAITPQIAAPAATGGGTSTPAAEKPTLAGADSFSSRLVSSPSFFLGPGASDGQPVRISRIIQARFVTEDSVGSIYSYGSDRGSEASDDIARDIVGALTNFVGLDRRRSVARDAWGAAAAATTAKAGRQSPGGPGRPRSSSDPSGVLASPSDAHRHGAAAAAEAGLARAVAAGGGAARPRGRWATFGTIGRFLRLRRPNSASATARVHPESASGVGEGKPTLAHTAVADSAASAVSHSSTLSSSSTTTTGARTAEPGHTGPPAAPAISSSSSPSSSSSSAGAGAGADAGTLAAMPDPSTSHTSVGTHSSTGSAPSTEASSAGSAAVPALPERHHNGKLALGTDAQHGGSSRSSGVSRRIGLGSGGGGKSKAKPKPALVLVGRSLGIFGPRNPLRRLVALLVRSKWFERVILLYIAASCVILALDDPMSDPDSALAIAVRQFDAVTAGVFAWEMAFRIIADGLYFNGPRSYLRSVWNVADMGIVFASVLSLAMDDSKVRSLRALRALRSLRPLRILRALPGLRLIVNSMLLSTFQVVNVLLIFAIFLFVFALLCVGTFKGAMYHCAGGAFDSLSVLAKQLITDPVAPADLTPDQAALFSAPGMRYPGPEPGAEAPTSRMVCLALLGGADVMSAATAAAQAAAVSASGASAGAAALSAAEEFLASVDPSALVTLLTPGARDDGDMGSGPWRPVVQGGNFDNVGQALITLFGMTTTEGWTEVMKATMDSRGPDTQPVRDSNAAWALFWAMFMLLGAFFVARLFIAVVLDNYNDMKARLGGSAFLTEGQREWVRAQKVIARIRPLAKVWRAEPGWPSSRKAAWYVSMHPWAERFYTAAILANTALLAAPQLGAAPDYNAALRTANLFFNAVFTIELLARLGALRLARFFADGWNVLDFAVVVASNVSLVLEAVLAAGGVGSSAAGAGSAIALTARAMRLGRVLRLVGRSSGLTRMFNTFLAVLPSLANTGALIALVLYAYAVIGVELFRDVEWGQLPPGSYAGGLTRSSNFQSFGSAFMTLFRAFTGEGWNTIMADLAAVRPGCLDLTALSYDEKKHFCGYTPYHGLLRGEGVRAESDLASPCVPVPGCGAPELAYPYFITYALIVSLIFLNLLIAVVLEGFDEVEGAASARLNDAHFRVLSDAWGRLDPAATLYIDCNDLPYLLQGLDEPLGFGKRHMATPFQLRRRIARLHLPVYGASRVHFVDVAQALASRVFADDARKAAQKRAAESDRDLVVLVAGATSASPATVRSARDLDAGGFFSVPRTEETRQLKRAFMQRGGGAGGVGGALAPKKSGFDVQAVWAARLIQAAWRRTEKRRVKKMMRAAAGGEGGGERGGGGGGGGYGSGVEAAAAAK